MRKDEDSGLVSSVLSKVKLRREIRRDLKLASNEELVAVWCETQEGSGWKSNIVWILVVNKQGVLRRIPLPPEQQSLGLQKLFHIAESVHTALVFELAN